MLKTDEGFDTHPMASKAWAESSITKVTTVQLKEEDDDAPTQPGDVLATLQEAEAEARRCRLDIGIQRKLMKAAGMILNTTTSLKGRCQPEDLLQEALVAILSGRRKWKKNKVDFMGLVFGVMKSLASSQDQSLQTKDRHVVLERELAARDEDDAEGFVENHGNADMSPEAALVEAEQQAQRDDILMTLRAKFTEDDLAGRILDKMIERQGFMPADIRKALDVSDREFWSAHRRVTRAFDALCQSGKKS
jgi:DNA-directed RNA polymerase specialized sigma24 family protein